MKHASVVGDLVVGKQQEAHVHAFDYRPKACHSCSNTHPHESILCMHIEVFADSVSML